LSCNLMGDIANGREGFTESWLHWFSVAVDVVVGCWW
jgi:hypothetical protein